MAIQISKRLFNIHKYERINKTNILDKDSNIELIEDIVINMHPPRKHRFTVEEYNALIEASILKENDRIELINKKIVQMSPIKKHHVAYVNRLTTLFNRHANQSTIVSIQNPVELLKHGQPQPDVALLKLRDDPGDNRISGQHNWTGALIGSMLGVAGAVGLLVDLARHLRPAKKRHRAKAHKGPAPR